MGEDQNCSSEPILNDTICHDAIIIRNNWLAELAQRVELYAPSRMYFAMSKLLLDGYSDFLNEQTNVASDKRQFIRNVMI